MKITEVRYTFACTMNLGNYESARCEVGLTAQVDEGEDPQVVLASLRAHVHDTAHQEMEECYANPPTAAARQRAKDKTPF